MKNLSLKFTSVDSFISVDPFTFMGPFPCMGPFRFCGTLLHLHWTIHCHIGPFSPVSPHPVRAFEGGPHRLWF